MCNFIKFIQILPLFLIIFFSCKDGVPAEHENSDTYPLIFPYNTDSITIPINIAPLNFSFSDNIEDAVVVVEPAGMPQNLTPQNLTLKGKQINFPVKKWKKILQTTNKIKIQAYTRQNKRWTKHKVLTWFVSKDSIDPYITYRLVERDRGQSPISLCERELSTFNNKTILLSSAINHRCFNCHTYSNRNPDNFVVHLRPHTEGSYLVTNGKIKKITLPLQAIKKGIRLMFAAFHPCGDYIVFSTSNIKDVSSYCPEKTFFSFVDSLAYQVLYNVKTNTLIQPKQLSDTNYIYTYSTWSQDGRTLYFCRGPRETPPVSEESQQRLEKFRQGIYSISFNAQTGQFSDTINIVASDTFFGGGNFRPIKLSPDQKHIVAMFSRYSGNPLFSDDCQITLTSKTSEGYSTRKAAELNVKQGEYQEDRWPSFSSNGKWLMFASKRIDNFVTNVFFAYFDGEKFGKPFVLPQKNGDYYKTSYKNFSMPEFLIKTTKGTANDFSKLKDISPEEINVENLE